MSLAERILPVTVLLPLGVASLLLIFAKRLPSRVSNVAAIFTALAVAALCVTLVRATVEQPVMHWFGGWTPQSAARPGVVLGIGFRADAASAVVATFCAVLFAASLTFASGFFDAAHSHFQIVMLLFLAAITGFCLTHDLFNLFVWFELMSVAAFALTAYPLQVSSLEGAFNFTVTNSLASFLMLAGVGLLYMKTGTLDFDQTARVVAAQSTDAGIMAGFCLMAVALLTKAAIVPFHMWLSDAHAVAPSPVSVIFSGTMVGVAVFVLMKLTTEVFARDLLAQNLVHSAFSALGLITASVGALMAWAQRHLKRLLAFSTISHMGIMLTALGVTSSAASSATCMYLVGHGLVKGTLFMLVGIVLTTCAAADELTLYRRGRGLWPVGMLMVLSGLLLGGFPAGLLHAATESVQTDQAPLSRAVIVGSAALTGAAVLRAALRIFWGCSGTPGPERAAPTERENEMAERPLWLMMAPCVVLLALDLISPAYVGYLLGTVSPTAANARAQTSGVELSLQSWDSTILMSLILCLCLVRRRASSRIARLGADIERRPFDVLQRLHSGWLADYVTWMMLGLAVLVVASGWLMRQRDPGGPFSFGTAPRWVISRSVLPEPD